MARPTLKESLKKISELKSLIQIKRIQDIKNHDGLGEQLAIFISTGSTNPIFFTMETDYDSGDMVIKSPILSISYDEFDKINKKNIHTFINSTYKKMSEDFTSKIKANDKENSIHMINQDILKEFEKEISSLFLEVTFKNNITNLMDVVATLCTNPKKKFSNHS